MMATASPAMDIADVWYSFMDHMTCFTDMLFFVVPGMLPVQFVCNRRVFQTYFNSYTHPYITILRLSARNRNVEPSKGPKANEAVNPKYLVLLVNFDSLHGIGDDFQPRPITFKIKLKSLFASSNKYAGNGFSAL